MQVSDDFLDQWEHIIDGVNIASKRFQSGKKTAYSRAQNAPERLDLF
jgi:hypothetical protein